MSRAAARSAWADYLLLYREHTAFIKSLDPNHLVTSGDAQVRPECTSRRETFPTSSSGRTLGAVARQQPGFTAGPAGCVQLPLLREFFRSLRGPVLGPVRATSVC